MNKDKSKMFLQYHKWMTKLRDAVDKPERVPKINSRKFPSLFQEGTSKAGRKNPNLGLLGDLEGHGDKEDEEDDQKEQENPPPPATTTKCFADTLKPLVLTML